MISVTILTKNSSKTLGKTLESLASFPEVLVYDTGSSDETLSIARNYPNVRVMEGAFQGFGPTHNTASECAHYDWILSIDSDEILSEGLAKEILSLSLSSTCVYELERHNFFNQKRIRCCGGWYPDPLVRLYHRKHARFSDAAVHEKILHPGLSVVPLTSPLFHTPYRSVDELLHKMQLYSTLFASQHERKGSLFTALLHGWAAFLKSYLIKKGCLGGREGLILSLYNGHTAFYKYLKLIELKW
jgi:glycosyltransferase involved in cell wall biosynthesis